LVQKMGFGDRLLGLRRYDFFHLAIAAEAPPEQTVEALTATLARQSTFYNRNKHMYSLECRWQGGERVEGPAHQAMVSGFARTLAARAERRAGLDFNGKREEKVSIVNGSPAFLIEVFVQDDDQGGRDAIAAKLTRELTASVGHGSVKVQCPGRATVWWLAVGAPSEADALATARQMTVTRRRDEGLLMNPNYQSAEFVSAGRVDTVRS
ncbi:MAG TPA: hypothetical protein VF128_11760, partial [Gemmatimonadaceae bacterium]